MSNTDTDISVIETKKGLAAEAEEAGFRLALPEHNGYVRLAEVAGPTMYGYQSTRYSASGLVRAAETAFSIRHEDNAPVGEFQAIMHFGDLSYLFMDRDECWRAY